MSDGRGLGPDGKPRDIRVDRYGQQYVTSRVYRSPLIKVPGLTLGGAYEAADAFGTMITISGLPNEGVITNVFYFDYDDEGITKELVLFDEAFVEAANDAAFDITDADLRKVIGVINIATFRNYSLNQFGQATPALYYATDVRTPGTLYGQFVTRGADNIAAGSEPEFYFTVVT